MPIDRQIVIETEIVMSVRTDLQRDSKIRSVHPSGDTGTDSGEGGAR
jgi:hypothetical protein